MRKKLVQLGMILILMFSFVSVEASDLIIGARSEPAIDPHFSYLTTNIAYARHIFGVLVQSDEDSNLAPGLAVSWKAVNDTTWEFKLRKGVKFHDGSLFTAKDVVFSINRIPTVPNSPNPFTGTIRSIKSSKVIDDYTVQFITKEINPFLPKNLSEVIIVSEKAAKGASTADFNSGKAAIGTGPYRFVKYVSGDRLVLKRFEDYWGQKPDWDSLTFKIISDDAARVAALMGGDVDLIDFVPPVQVSTLEKSKNLEVFKRPSDRIIYLFVNVEADSSPFLTDLNGNPLPENPLRNPLVRQAIAASINREAIVARIMDGLATAESQTIPKDWFGYNADLKNPEYDPSWAKKLLAKAGYPDGFGITIHGPNDRYVNDGKICQAVGQMLSRIGLKVKVDTSPKAVFFPKIGPPGTQFALGLLGWGNSPLETDGLVGLMHTFSKEKGMGQYNAGGYGNPAFDSIVEKALVTVDEAERSRLEQKASRIAMQDIALIPLHTQFTIAAARKGIHFVPRADEATLAMNAKKN
ncbi:ABC transporter substrate-binding protein [bacterium]|nr:ABC transporter substrate-binding protein [bacterium]